MKNDTHTYGPLSIDENGFAKLNPWGSLPTRRAHDEMWRILSELTTPEFADLWLGPYA